ncbi:MAG: histidine phosphatase family protein [Eubacterium sp.]|nr:histidine phosphatase family protein [Eubacterium sp.]
MELVLIRHFPTPGNLLRQYIGRTDEALDTDYLMDYILKYRGLYQPKHCLISSPMVRCQQTAKVLFPGQDMKLCEELRETDFGIFEGKTYEELKDTPEYQEWLDSNGEGLIPEGESKDAFRKRCVNGFETIMQELIRNRESSAAIVTHGGVVMALMSEYAEEKQDFYHWQVKNGCGFSVVVEEEKWKAGTKQFVEIQKIEPLNE